MSFVQVCPQYAKCIRYYATHDTKITIQKDRTVPIPLYQFKDGKEPCYVHFDRIGTYRVKLTLLSNSKDVRIDWMNINNTNERSIGTLSWSTSHSESNTRCCIQTKHRRRYMRVGTTRTGCCSDYFQHSHDRRIPRPIMLVWCIYVLKTNLAKKNKQNMDSSRYVLFPIRHAAVWRMYKKHVASFWTVEELQVTGQDLKDWDSLNKNEQHFIKMVLAFFASADGIVNENLAERFMREVPVPEVRCFYGFQIMMENIHSETYSLLLETFVKEPAERERLFDAIQKVPSVRKKAEWAMKWIDSKEASFVERLVAFACVEGIFFSGSFCAIFWLNKRGKLPVISFSNQLISRDEGLHCDFACLLYTTLFSDQKLDQKRIESIVREAVAVEHEFVSESLPVQLIGMNSTDMCQYIDFVADRLLDALGHKKMFQAPNPFDFMEAISLTGKTNFFEGRNSSYQRAGVLERLQSNNNKTEEKTNEFNTNADF